MAYVDLHRRRLEEERLREDPGDFPRDAGHAHYPSLAVGAALGILFAAFWGNGAYLLFPDLPSGALLTFALVLLAVGGIWGFRRRGRAGIAPEFDKERGLLMAIREAGGVISAVDAAMETSLTVEEADGMLSALADRGHLLLESRDGALFYALPGKRFAEASAANG